MTSEGLGSLPWGMLCYTSATASACSCGSQQKPHAHTRTLMSTSAAVLSKLAGICMAMRARLKGALEGLEVLRKAEAEASLMCLLQLLEGAMEGSMCLLQLLQGLGGGETHLWWCGPSVEGRACESLVGCCWSSEMPCALPCMALQQPPNTAAL